MFSNKSYDESSSLFPHTDCSGCESDITPSQLSCTDDGYEPDIDDDDGFPIAPKCRLTTWQIIVINLPWFGLSLMYLVLTIEVVPVQVQALVGPNVKGTVLGIMVSIGAVLTLMVAPLIGLQSDRMNTRIGRRRPVMFASAILLCLGLTGMALSTSNVQMRGNSTSTECITDLKAKRCAPYINSTHSSRQLSESTNHVRLSGKSGLSQSGSVGLPLFEYIAAEHMSGYIGAFFGCYLFSVASYAGITVPYTALIADRTHPDQRGISSGVMGGMVLLGNIGGACLGIFITDLGLYAIYGIICGIVLVCICTAMLTISELQEKHCHKPLSCRAFLGGFMEPFKDRDFRWLFFTRFLMQQGVFTIYTFIQYWVADMVHVPLCWPIEKAVAILLAPLVSAAAFCSVLFGVLSDRIRRRKPLVICSAIIMSLAAGSFPFIRGGENSYYIALILVFISGIGYGTYLSVDFALLLDVLPSHHDKAKDIAVWNQALIIPQILATPLGGFVLDFFEQFDCEIGLGYIILFSLTCIYFLMSGVFVVKVSLA